jgi:hypothetical protein
MYLSAYYSKNALDWPKKLPLVEFAHNSRTHSNRSQTPFELMYSHPLKAFPTDQEPMNNPATEDRIDWIKNICIATQDLHEKARQTMTECIKGPLPKLEVGQKVWLDSRNLPIRAPSRKLSAKRVGPFEITKKLGPVNYELKLPKSWKVHPRFHIGLLWPVTENNKYGNHFENPPPDLVEGEEEWEIKDIVHHCKTCCGKIEYLIHWKGYPNLE